jgi:hypothetical protein
MPEVLRDAARRAGGARRPSARVRPRDDVCRGHPCAYAGAGRAECIGDAAAFIVCAHRAGRRRLGCPQHRPPGRRGPRDARTRCRRDQPRRPGCCLALSGAAFRVQRRFGDGAVARSAAAAFSLLLRRGCGGGSAGLFARRCRGRHGRPCPARTGLRGIARIHAQPLMAVRGCARKGPLRGHFTGNPPKQRWPATANDRGAKRERPKRGTPPLVWRRAAHGP